MSRLSYDFKFLKGTNDFATLEDLSALGNPRNLNFPESSSFIIHT